MRIDADRVKEAVKGRFAEVFEQATGFKLGTKHGPCPKCGGGDTAKRFRFDPVREFVICNDCFKEGNGDIFAAVQWANSLSFPDALKLIAGIVGVEGSPEVQVDGLAAVARAKGVTREAFASFGGLSIKGGAKFPTFDVAGGEQLWFTIHATGADKLRKGVFERARDGKFSGMFLPVVDGRPRFPQADETWHVAEGVKDPAALWSLGLLAAGLPTSSMNKKFAAMFRGVHVILVPDLDVAGFEKGANQTAARLRGISASVKIARLPGEIKDSGGADVRDVLKQPGGEQLVREAIAEAREWQPARVETETVAASEIAIWIDEHRTDIFNARRLTRLHGRVIRYCGSWGSWLLFDGQRWHVDKSYGVHGLAKDVSEGLWDEAIAAEIRFANPQLAESMKSFARSSSSASGIRNMCDLARSEVGIGIGHEQLDNDPWLLNVSNGTIDLRTRAEKTFREHDSADLITAISHVHYDPAAKCPGWDKFIEEVTCGREKLANYLRRLVGYALTGVVRESMLAFLYGEGSNGKSVFVEVICELLGKDYAMRSAPELLMDRGGESHPTERADLFGKRLCASNEIKGSRSLNESLVKDLTGGDSIRARRMREDFWEFKPTHKVWMLGNHRPRIKGTDNGIWRRLKMIPFDGKWVEPGDAKPGDLVADLELKPKLLSELPGILNWALAGCAEWQEEGMGESDEVAKATAEYRTSEDVIGTFIEESCVVGKHCTVKAGTLYVAYRDWAEKAGERVSSVRTFGEEVSRRFERERSDGIWYTGLGLKTKLDGDQQHADEQQEIDF